MLLIARSITPICLIYFSRLIVLAWNRSCRLLSSIFNDLHHTWWTIRTSNLTSLEVGALWWLRPQQLLEASSAVGRFIRTLSLVSRLSLDLTSPGFRIFDGLSTYQYHSQQDEWAIARIIHIEYLYWPAEEQSITNYFNFLTLRLLSHLLQMNSMSRLLHTCTCWGCNHVLERLRDLFSFTNHDDFSALCYLGAIFLANLRPIGKCVFPSSNALTI